MIILYSIVLLEFKLIENYITYMLYNNDYDINIIYKKNNN